MNQSKISFLFKLINIFIFFLTVLIHLKIFILNINFLYFILFLTFLPLINLKKGFKLSLYLISTLFLIFILFYFNKAINFSYFIENSILIILFILFFNIIEKSFSDLFLIPILTIYLIIFEKIVGINLILIIFSTSFIILSIFFKHLKNKGFYFWENDFSIKGNPYIKSFKYLLISLIFFPVFYLITFISLPDIRKLFVFEFEKGLENVNKINEKNPKLTEITLRRFIFGIRITTQKIVYILLNSLYLIIFIGFVISFIFIGFILYRLIKNVYGKIKARNFLIFSTLFSISLLTSIYFLYKPFEKFIFFLRDKLKIENIGTLPVGNLMSKIIKSFSPQSVTTKISNISIDLGILLLIISFLILTTISLYFLIYFLYSTSFNERKYELNKIIEGIKDNENNLYKIFGTPKEKIIYLYNNLIFLLGKILKKFIYETPYEYKERFNNEKPNVGKEFDLITENFLLAKYSNEKIEENLFNETFINYKKLMEKIFKEVYFGGKI